GQGSPFALSIVPDAVGAAPSAPAGGASAVLRPLGPLPVAGTVTFTPSTPAGSTTINATLQGVAPGSSVSVAVPLASGGRTLPSGAPGTGGPVTCTQSTTSQPSVGAMVIASVGGQAVAQGAIVPGSTGGDAPPAGPTSVLGGVLPLAGVLGGVLLAPAPGSSV